MAASACGQSESSSSLCEELGRQRQGRVLNRTCGKPGYRSLRMPLGTRSWRRPRGGNRAGGSAWVFQKRSCSSRPWRGHASVLWLSFAAAACRWWERCHAGACFGLCGRASICSHPWKDLACLYPKATLSPSDFYPVPEFPEKRTDAISAPQKRAAPPREEQACGERCAWCLLKDWYALSCLQGFFFSPCPCILLIMSWALG